ARGGPRCVRPHTKRLHGHPPSAPIQPIGCDGARFRSPPAPWALAPSDHHPRSNHAVARHPLEGPLRNHSVSAPVVVPLPSNESVAPRCSSYLRPAPRLPSDAPRTSVPVPRFPPDAPRTSGQPFAHPVLLLVPPAPLPTASRPKHLRPPPRPD